MNEWEKRPTDFILGIILHLRTVIQINIIYFCLGKIDTGSGPLYPVMGFGQIYVYLIRGTGTVKSETFPSGSAGTLEYLQHAECRLAYQFLRLRRAMSTCTSEKVCFIIVYTFEYI